MEKYPNNKTYTPSALVELAYNYECLYDFEGAIKTYEWIIEEFPAYRKQISPYALLRIGHCYLRLGKIRKAVDTLKYLSEKFPNLGELEGTIDLRHLIALYKDMPEEVSPFSQ